nr:MAG TPA: hypothetical protein [Caudoviricetes sp.]
MYQQSGFSTRHSTVRLPEPSAPNAPSGNSVSEIALKQKKHLWTVRSGVVVSLVGFHLMGETGTLEHLMMS